MSPFVARDFSPRQHDLSPPLKPVIGGSSKVRKMSYTHPNLILSVDMGSKRQEEEMIKDPF